MQRCAAFLSWRKRLLASTKSEASAARPERACLGRASDLESDGGVRSVERAELVLTNVDDWL